jgi:thiamine-monophosphate kinase
MSAATPAALSEFELIARYFTRPTSARQGVALIDVGDRTLAVSTDMLIEGRHFFRDVDPAALGHKALAVNLSDLAAAGATPRCFFLALGLPAARPVWLERFSAGLLALADRFDCALLGGDTTRMPAVNGSAGPLTLCITVLGECHRGQANSRRGAAPGDEIWVSGTLGDAALALACLTGETALDPAALTACRERLERPTPRVELGRRLVGLASACIDLSDGLLGDLRHVMNRSQVGARIEAERLPAGPALAAQPAAQRLRWMLAGGDDYELLFTAAPAQRPAVLAAAQAAGVGVSCIGAVTDGPALQVLDAAGKAVDTPFRAYDHFAPDYADHDV